MFDDEVVALGSNISGQYDVETTLENYKIDDHNRTYYVDGNEQTMSMDGIETAYSNVKTFNMQGNVEDSEIGFYFPNSLDINVKSETRSGTWSSLGEYNRDTTTYNADYFISNRNFDSFRYKIKISNHKGTFIGWIFLCG